MHVMSPRDRFSAPAAAGEEMHLLHLEAPSLAGSPWQRLYGAAHRLRWRWYRGRARRLPRPVISIGNLHWGGGGKTPLVAAVAGHLRARGAAVCVLSRGYGGRGHGVQVVSRGGGPLLGPEAAGDEPVLLAGELPGVAVVVGADRWRAGAEALARLRPTPDVFLLDDGFSHLALHRDLDLLAFPAADPFGGGRLWPGGRLREPLAAVSRADAVLLTGTPGGSRADPGAAGTDPVAAGAGPDAPVSAPGGGGAAGFDLGRPAGSGTGDGPGLGASGAAGPGSSRAGPEGGDGTGPGAELAAELRPFGFAGPGFACPLRAGGAVLHTAAGAVPLPPGSKVLLVSGIARPEGFAATARELDFAIVDELRFPDHHTFPPASLAAIAARVAASGAAVVLVTGKDRVKLLRRLAAPLAELPITAEPEPAFWRWLDAGVDRLLAGAAGFSGSCCPSPDAGGPER
jgi:tetraacyldisaccharide-1-P 4'-kinase